MVKPHTAISKYISCSKEPTMADTIKAAIAAAHDVWNVLGGGHTEAVYQKAMLIHLRDAGVRCADEQIVPIMYRGLSVGSCRADIVTQHVVIELKVAGVITDAHEQQCQKYMRCIPRPHGLLINFPQRRDATGPDFREYHNST